jgi:peptidoglycan/xylan/chitin deacetylase (PgdA/CDA1 family)
LRTDITRYVDGDAKWVFDSIRLEPGRDYLFSDYYKATAASRVLAAVTTASGTVDYIELPQALPEADWKQYKGVFTMPPDGVDVSIYHLLDRNGTLLTDDYAVSPYSLAGFSRGLVSLTFDDGWRNIYTNALPLLRKYGFASTQYVLAGKADDPEYMTTDMMAEFRGSGSEIASHTVTHPHLTQITSTCMRAEVADSQEYLRNAFGASAAADFAPPYGEFDESVLQAAREFYRSSRSTQVGFNARNSTDVYDIKVQNVENTTTTADVRRWVETAYRERTWLVLVYHEVDAQPADPTYAVSPSVLDEELQIVEDSGLAVMTVDQALDEITPQLHRE